MPIKKISVLVPGGLNTDIIGLGVPQIIGRGELTLGGEIKIGPGGKSRNIAQMIAVLVGRNKVAMIGRSVRDPFQLWRPPLEALRECGVNTDFVKVTDFKKNRKFPGIALIPVDPQGNNQIYVLPGINADFSPQDIHAAGALFRAAQKNQGVLALSLELPLATAIAAIQKAQVHGLKVILDPGGIQPESDYGALLKQKIFLIKPNEHEARILTGVTVRDMNSARRAAVHFFKRGVQHVMITAGAKGAYFLSRTSAVSIKPPFVKQEGPRDETGCGDQTMAALCAGILKGMDLPEACRMAIAAGTLQFHKVGITPVRTEELKKYVHFT